MKAPVRWPEGVQSALCLTVDIDGETMWTSVDPDNATRPFIVGQAEFEFNVGIPLFLELLERHGIRTTFFVCGGVALQHPDSIRSIHAAGHEVACHGWLHEPVHGFSREEELELIERSTNALEEVTGERPVGYRAGLADVQPQTWGILRELGYIYSSNLQTSLWPYLHAGDGPALLEIPLHASLDDGPYYLTQRNPANYRQYYSPHMVGEIFTSEFEGVHELGGVTDIVLHPQLSGRPSRLRVIEDLIEQARDTPGVWLPTMREIAEHCLAADAAALR